VWLLWPDSSPLWLFTGVAALLGAYAGTLPTDREVFPRISRKLETRADDMATANEGDAGTYARALTRLYADNLLPAVTAKERATHPHLYDRLLAAGVTPDFPRPAPAVSMAWHGHVFAGLVGMLFAVFAIRLMHHYGGTG
jgi:hypothetical protein